MKNNKQTGDPPKLKFLGRSQNPEIFNNIKKNVPGGYPKKGINTDNWTELKKFDNGDTLVEYNTLYNNSSNKASIAPSWALRDATTGKYHALDSFGDVEQLKKMFFGGPVDPLKPKVSSQESISMKPIPTMPFDINPYTGDNILANFEAKMLENPITPAERIAYKTYVTGDYQAPKNRMTDKRILPMNMQREKANGGLLTNGEYNLVNTLKQLLDKPVANVAPKKYSTGGKVLSALAGLIPGVGSIVSPMVGLVDQQIEKDNNQQSAMVKPMNMNTGIYGNKFNGEVATPDGIVRSQTITDVKALGGMITKNFKQYNTGSHASGNDLNINESGSPSTAASTASVQNQENAYTSSKGNTYVHSDVLTNPESGNTFNVDAAKLNKKFSKADKSPEDKNALDFTMNRLSLINDKVRTMQESVQMALGGNTKKLATGGIPSGTIQKAWDAWNSQQENKNLSIPPSDNAFYDTNAEQLSDLPASMTSLSTPPVVSMNTAAAPNLSGLVSDEPLVLRDGIPGNPTKQTGLPMAQKAAMVAKAIGLAKSGIDAMTPAEKENPLLPDYTKSDKQMYSTNIDYTQAKQDALAAANMASNVNRSASGSFEQFQGREANNFANLADNLGKTSMQEALGRNQLAIQRAGYEQGKAIDKTNRLSQNRIDNQMNQANADLADQKFFSEITDVGSQFNKYANYKEMVTNKKELAQAAINEGIALMGTKYANFGFSDDFIEKIKSGTASIDEMTQFIATTQEIKKKETKKSE